MYLLHSPGRWGLVPYVELGIASNPQKEPGSALGGTDRMVLDGIRIETLKFRDSHPEPGLNQRATRQKLCVPSLFPQGNRAGSVAIAGNALLEGVTYTDDAFRRTKRFCRRRIKF